MGDVVILLRDLWERAIPPHRRMAGWDAWWDELEAMADE